MDAGEAKVESHASYETRPCQAALLLDTLLMYPGRPLHQCVGGNTVHLVSACTVPGLPQESLVRNETRISLPAKPSLTRMTLGQLIVHLPVAAGYDRAWARTQGLWWHPGGGI